MNAKERKQHENLLRLWATGRATMKQMQRCMELDRKTASVIRPIRVGGMVMQRDIWNSGDGESSDCPIHGKITGDKICPLC